MLSAPIPPSTWTWTSPAGATRAARAIRGERLGHELLARVAGVDAHAEHEVGASAAAAASAATGVPGLKASPTPSPSSRASAIVGRVVGHLDVEGDAVAAGARDLRDVALGVVDHQVAVE